MQHVKAKIENLKAQHPNDAAKVKAATVEALEALAEKLETPEPEPEQGPAPIPYYPGHFPDNHPEQ